MQVVKKENDKDLNKPKQIETVPEYLIAISEEMQKYNGKILVFRGEDETFEKPCRPNIFRRESLVLDHYFEKQLFDSMRQNGLSSEINYLFNAIDAQHGTFPSRMLDVTYNCLVALYFAVTPFYHEKEDKNDDKDGAVYVFSFDHAYSPSSNNIQECYDSIIQRKTPLLADNILFSKNHKFIDHCKINKRIIAQQGAFVLFQGDDAEGLPACSYSVVKIPAKSKQGLRQELNLMFGIHTGYIYPEIDNLSDELSSKCKTIETRKIDFFTEMDDVEEQLMLEISYYIEKTYTNDNPNFFRLVEKVMYSYYIGILQLYDYYNNKFHSDDFEEKEKVRKRIIHLINQYNMSIEELNLKTKKLSKTKSSVDFSNLKIEIHKSEVEE